MHAATAMELEPVAAPIEGAESSSKSEQAGYVEIGALMGLVRVLFSKAEEIEQQAQKLERECLGDEEAQNEIANAKLHAQTMLSTAQQINAELGATSGNQRHGQKKLSSSRVNTLSCTADQIIHSAEREKSALVSAFEEVRAHQSQSKSAASNKASAESTGIASTVRRAARTLLPATTPAAMTHDVARLRQQVQLHLHQWQQTALEVHARIAHATTQSVDWVESTASAAVETGKQAVEKTKAAVQEYVVVPAVQLKDKVVASAKSAYQATTQVVSNTVESVKTKASEVRQWVSAQYEAKKTALLALLPFADAPKPAEKTMPVMVKPATPSTFDSMAQALKQAAALALPLSLAPEAVSGMWSFSAPNLPKINAAISSLSLWN